MYRIGLDIDDVLYPWSQRAYEAICAAGKDKGLGLPSMWEMHEHYGLGRDEFWNIINAAYMDGMLLNAPYDGVQDLIYALMWEGYEVHLVTARGCSEGDMAQMVREQTRECLRTHSVPHDSLTFTKDKAALGLDYFLDDGIHNVTALREAGCEAYLRDQCHNQDSDLPRVADLEEFVEVVLAEARVQV